MGQSISGIPMLFSDYSFLYVEDDPLSRQVMEMMMKSVLGVQHLALFHDSSDFIERLEALPYVPDVILLDIHMSPVNGFVLLQMLRKDKRFASSKVIAITASVMSDEINRLQSSGFDGAIGKPLSLQTFPDLIERILRGEAIWNAS
jgi:CheY-like chemotaxis protein